MNASLYSISFPQNTNFISDNNRDEFKAFVIQRALEIALKIQGNSVGNPRLDKHQAPQQIPINPSLMPQLHLRLLIPAIIQRSEQINR